MRKERDSTLFLFTLFREESGYMARAKADGTVCKNHFVPDEGG